LKSIFNMMEFYLLGSAVNFKNQNVHKNQKIKQFLNTLNQKQAKGFVQIKSWIDEIV